MVLLERAELLADLHAQWDAACAGRGRIVFLEGEAGIGKTSVLEAFVASVQPRGCVVHGGCDALRVPRPLAALEDIAQQVGGELAAALSAAIDRHRAFRAFVELLQARPTLAVLEDLHWADEATLDLVRFVARRVGSTPSMIVASYRSDELVPAHPLRLVLGDAATRGALRLSPAPLSNDAVEALALHRGAVIDVDAVQARTGGNPFFVTELLAAGQGCVPATVQDAVLARAARLSVSARAVLDAAAILGPRIEPRLLEAAVAAERAAIEEGLATGVIRAESGHYMFRHELAREAVLQAMTPTRAASLHRRALDTLLATLGESPDRLDDAAIGRQGVAAHLTRHAEGAGDLHVVARWAPVAARAAGARGAHREAARHWNTALRHALDEPTRATLLDAEAEALRATGAMEAAVASRQAALSLWRALNRPTEAAATLAELSILHLLTSRHTEADAALREANHLLLASGRTLTRGLRLATAQLRLHTGDAEAALAIAESVLADAEQSADRQAAVAALNTLGAARMLCEQTNDAIADLERGLALAESSGAHLQVAMLLANLGGGCASAYRLEVAERTLDRGIALCRDRDLDAPRLHQTASLAVVRTLQGRWDDAVALATDVIENPSATAIARVKAHATIGRVRARCGEGDPWPAFEAAQRLAGDAAASTAALAVLRAEAAWLEGRPDASAREVSGVASRQPAMRAELALWRRLGGMDPVEGSLVGVNHPCAIEAAGNWRLAAATWRTAGCRFETARALAAGDEPAQLAALALCEELGARPLADRIRRALRVAGARAVPRGPRAETRDQVAGLTQTEVAVLMLLVAGLRNKDIALRMSRSPRTVEHHVERVYGKLGVTSRAEAVSAALQRGIVAPK